jgi:hypothetical protein
MSDNPLINDYLNQLAEKQTSILWPIYTGLSAAALVLNGQGMPTGQIRLKVTISASGTHTDCSGTITINGTEVLTYTVAASKTTTTYLSSLPTITTANLDCWIVIQALDTAGNALYYVTWTPFACRWVNVQEEYQSSTGTWLLSNNKVTAAAVYTAATVIRKYGTTTTFTIMKVLDVVDLDGNEDFLTYIT